MTEWRTEPPCLHCSLVSTFTGACLWRSRMAWMRVKRLQSCDFKICSFLPIRCPYILFLLLPAAATWDQRKADSKRLCFPWLSTTEVCFLPLVQLVVTQTFHVLLFSLSHQHKQHWSLVLSVTHEPKYKTGTLNLYWRITCGILLCTSKLVRPFFLFIYFLLFPLSAT